MRVFVTGATGFIGSAVVKELQAHGHGVLGMARTDEGARALEAAGVEVHRGDVTDPASIVAGAEACDGIAHLAFIHDFSKFMDNIATDRRLVETVASALEGTGKPFVATFGTMLLTPGQTVTEDFVPGGQTHHPRAAIEDVLVQAAGRGVRTGIVRLPPTVHGRGDKGFVPMLIDIARRAGFSAYVGDGANRWPAVHRTDAAALYRLMLERGEPGTRLHAIAEDGIPYRAIAEAIGTGLGVPVRGLSPEEAQEHFTWMAMFVGADAPASAEATRRAFDWRPTGPDLLTDLREGGYFG